MPDKQTSCIWRQSVGSCRRCVTVTAWDRTLAVVQIFSGRGQGQEQTEACTALAAKLFLATRLACPSIVWWDLEVWEGFSGNWWPFGRRRCWANVASRLSPTARQRAALCIWCAFTYCSTVTASAVTCGMDRMAQELNYEKRKDMQRCNH